jgi:uncharacterized protein (DUF2062 family)
VPRRDSSPPPPGVDARTGSRPLSWLEALLQLHDTPTRTAAAFALGVFFSFSPFIGLQILLSMVLAFLLGLNRLAVFVGLNANLPWVMVPWYVGATALAARVLGVEAPTDVSLAVAEAFGGSWSPTAVAAHLRRLMTPVLVPFLIGSTGGAALLGGLAFVGARSVLVRRAAGGRG